MSAVAHILYPRIAATITLPVGTTAAGFPLTNLQNCSMAHTWKAGGVASDATFLVDLGSVQTVGALAILGHNLYSARNSSSTYTDITISWSDDFVAWNVVVESPTEHQKRIASDLPYILTLGVSARYFEIAIADPNATQSYAYEIAEMFVAGAVLSLTEPTSYQWTPHDMKAHSRTAGSDVGMGIPPHHSYITHDPKVEIGKQGIANDFFDDLVKSSAYPLTHAAPSFQHFIRTCWSLGAPFVYCPAYAAPVEPTTDAFTRGDEAPLASPWTKIHDGELNLVGNLVTRDGEAGGATSTLYIHDTEALDGSGHGWAQVKVRFSDVAAASVFHRAGVAIQRIDPVGTYPIFWGVIYMGGSVTIETNDGGLLDSAVFAPADNTWYTIRLELTADTISMYVDNVEVLSSAYPASNPGDIGGRHVGMIVDNDDPADCITEFNDFAAGEALYQTAWIGATVCRAPASGKLRTPFTESWRRKLEMSMQSTGEWTGR